MTDVPTARHPETEDRSIAALIANALGERIIRGDLAPNERLRQDRIAEQFGASHVPVREAFRRLEARGLVLNAPRKGVCVAPLDPDRIIEITKIRATLECLALDEAMPAIGASELDEMRAAIETTRASDDILVWAAANHRFHGALYRPCGMPTLLSLLDDLHAQSSRYLFATWKHRRWGERSLGEHERILACVAGNDTDGAIRILRQHILDAGRALVDFLRQPPDPLPGSNGN